jgi:hypothetical protein
MVRNKSTYKVTNSDKELYNRYLSELEQFDFTDRRRRDFYEHMGVVV